MTKKHINFAYGSNMSTARLLARLPNAELLGIGTLQKEAPEANFKAFKRGFLVNALNPKATLFFMSLFTLVIASTTPTSVQAMYGVYMALATWAWFSFLSVVLSKASVRAFFQRAGHWFDRGIGVVLIALAIRVVV